MKIYWAHTHNILRILAGVGLYPIVLNYFSVEQVAIWSLAMTIIALASVFDFGMTPIFLREFSKFQSKSTKTLQLKGTVPLHKSAQILFVCSGISYCIVASGLVLISSIIDTKLAIWSLLFVIALAAYVMMTCKEVQLVSIGRIGYVKRLASQFLFAQYALIVFLFFVGQLNVEVLMLIAAVTLLLGRLFLFRSVDNIANSASVCRKYFVNTILYDCFKVSCIGVFVFMSQRGMIFILQQRVEVAEFAKFSVNLFLVLAAFSIVNVYVNVQIPRILNSPSVWERSSNIKNTVRVLSFGVFALSALIMLVAELYKLMHLELVPEIYLLDTFELGVLCAFVGNQCIWMNYCNLLSSQGLIIHGVRTVATGLSFSVALWFWVEIGDVYSLILVFTVIEVIIHTQRWYKELLKIGK